MATVQKTTFRRFNGIDWDSIYFSSAADITILGNAYTVAKDEDGFSYGDVLEANDSIAMLLTKTINRLATIETERLSALESGSGITELDVSKLVGIISRDNLPADVSGKGLEVENDAAKDALTKDDVNIGDIVKVNGGKIYLVTGEEPDDPEVENGPTHLTYMTLADDKSDVDWARITNRPTTVDGYGITDGLKTTDAVDHGTKREGDAEDFTSANKVAKTNADGKLDFDITGDAATLGGNAPEYYATATGLQGVIDAIGDEETDGTIRKDIKTLQDEMKNQDASWLKTGTISLARLPKAAISELHIITSEDDLANLTTEQVQLGDTVKIADELNEDGTIKVAGGMFYVADETKLGTEDYRDAFVPYTASAASSVYWSGVLETPTTLAGYGITDAVNVNQLANKGGAAAASKVAQANAEGKLDFDITGDAATLGGNKPEYYATAESVTTLTTEHEKTVEKLQELVKAVMGDETETPTTPPSSDPENPVYTQPIEDAAAGDTVTWAGKGWTVVSKDDEAGTALLAANEYVAARVSYPGSMLDTGIAAVKEAMSEDAKTLLMGDPFVPSTEQIQALTDKTFADDYWLTDAIVSAAGEITPTDPSTETKGAYIRAFATINLAHPDKVEPGPGTSGGTLVDRVTSLETLMGTAPEGYTSTVMDDLAALKEGSAVKNIAADKITGTLTRDQLPSDISGRIIEVADLETAFTTLTAENASVGDLVFLDSGAVYSVKDVTKLDTADGYKMIVDVAGSTIEWSQITKTPTTLAGYGIADGVNVSDVIDNGIYDAETNANVAGKIVKIAEDNKLHVDITGDAATLGGHAAEYFATKEAFDKLALSVPVVLDSVDDFPNPQIGQVVIVPAVVAATPEPEPNPDEGGGEAGGETGGGETA